MDSGISDLSGINTSFSYQTESLTINSKKPELLETE